MADEHGAGNCPCLPFGSVRVVYRGYTVQWINQKSYIE